MGRILDYEGECHHGKCRRCGKPWCEVESKSVYYTKTSGFFTHCVDCFDLATVEEKKAAAEALMVIWRKNGDKTEAELVMATFDDDATDFQGE